MTGGRTDTMTERLSQDTRSQIHRRGRSINVQDPRLGPLGRLALSPQKQDTMRGGDSTLRQTPLQVVDMSATYQGESSISQDYAKYYKSLQTRSKPLKIEVLKMIVNGRRGESEFPAMTAK